MSELENTIKRLKIGIKCMKEDGDPEYITLDDLLPIIRSHFSCTEEELILLFQNTNVRIWWNANDDIDRLIQNGMTPDEATAKWKSEGRVKI